MLALCANAAATEGLTAAQQAEIDMQTASMRKENAQKNEGSAKQKAEPSIPVAKRVDEWVDVGLKVGQAMGGAAKEMSIAVNEFAKTPVGIITLMIIVFKMMGTWVITMLVHLGSALIVMITGFSFIRYMNRNTRSVVMTYDTEKRDLLGRSTRSKIEYGKLNDDSIGASYAVAAVTIIIALFAAFTGSW